MAVHPDLDVGGLTISQLRDICTGKIDNWKEVGGSDIAIAPHSRSSEAGGTVEFFVDNILGGEEFGVDVEFISTTT